MPEDLAPDEILILREYRRTKCSGHADGAWSVKDGKLVKLWTTPKVDIEAELQALRGSRTSGRLRES